MFQCSVTRRTAETLREHGITKELSIELERNFKIEALSFLNHGRCGQSAQAQPQTEQTRPTRRASVAGTNVFVVGSQIRETGFDYLHRIPRSQNVQIDRLNATHSTATTATTTNFSLKIGKRGNHPNSPTNIAPLPDSTDPNHASDNMMKSADSAILGASQIHLMESFDSLARGNDGETCAIQHGQPIHLSDLSYRSNFGSDSFVDAADSSLAGSIEDLGLNRLFVDQSDLKNNEDTNTGTDMESSHLFDTMWSSASSNNDDFGIASLYIDSSVSLGDENCK